MKRLIVIALVMIGLQVNAQDRKRDHSKTRHDRAAMMHELSAEDIATLQTKKMTLHLDLSESQQTKVKALVLEETKVKKAKMAEMKATKEAGTMEKPSKEERASRMNERLDRQIAMKRQMKDILNDEQYQKWQKSMEKRSDKRGRKGRSKESRKK